MSQKPTKIRYKCIHNKEKFRCKECKKEGTGGSSICEHSRQKYRCKECKEGNNSICEHNKERYRCIECIKLGYLPPKRSIDKNKKCYHNNQIHICAICKINGSGGESLCDHNIQKQFCPTCKINGSGSEKLCVHNKRKFQCIVCKTEEQHQNFADNCLI